MWGARASVLPAAEAVNAPAGLPLLLHMLCPGGWGCLPVVPRKLGELEVLAGQGQGTLKGQGVNWTEAVSALQVSCALPARF